MVFSPFVGVDDPKKRSGVRIGTPTAVPFTDVELKSVVEIVGVGNPPVSSQSRKSGEHNEEQNDNFEDAESVEKADTPLGQCRMK